jgi:hypothetical protein
MTFCAAAVCHHKNRRAIVVCADWQGTIGGFLKVEDTRKYRHINACIVLLSGIETQAVSLYHACIPALRKYTSGEHSPRDDFDLRESALKQDIERVARQFLIEKNRRSLKLSGVST